MKKSIVLLACSLLCSSSFALETRVFVKPRCVVTGDPPKALETGALAAAFLANVVGSLVSTGMDALAKSLGENVLTVQRGLNRGSHWYVSGEKGAVKINPDIGCLIALVGEDLRAVDDAPTEPEIQALEASLKLLPQDADPTLRLHAYSKELAKLGLTRAPVLYFEAKFANTNIAPVFSLNPSYISYPKFFGGKVPLGKEDRDVAISIQFSTVGGDFASAILTFDNLKEGALNTARISSSVLPWMSMPSTEGISFVNKKAMPFNVQFQVTETAKPGVLGKALAGAITASKEEVKQLAETKVKLAVSASERQAARNAATAAANTALAAYFDAFAEWETAKDALSKVAPGNAAAKKKAQLALDIRKSMLDNAQAAAREAMENAGVPFSPIETQ